MINATPPQPCTTARERYGPGKSYRLVDFDRHVASCAECQRFVRAKRKEQRTRTRYSRAFPITGDVHKYLLIVPEELWQRFEKRRVRENVSARSVLNRLLEHYIANGVR